MNRFATLGAAASLTLGGLVFMGCQSEDNNRDNSAGAQTSGDVYAGTPSSTGSSRYNGSSSDSPDRNDEPGRGLSSSNMETHGGPSRLTGGENVGRQGIGVTDDLRAGSAAQSTDSSTRTLSGSSDVTQPRVEPSEAVPTTQPSVEISK